MHQKRILFCPASNKTACRGYIFVERTHRAMTLEELYIAYRNQTYSLCLRLAPSKDIADELFSDTWARIAEKYRNVKDDGNPMSWVYTVCLNVYRKSARRWSRSGLFSLIHESHAGVLLHEDEPAPESERALRDAIDRLDDKYRLPVILFYYKDMSYNDICAAMRLPISTVKYRLNRAKELLRQKLEQL